MKNSERRNYSQVIRSRWDLRREQSGGDKIQVQTSASDERDNYALHPVLTRVISLALLSPQTT